MIATRLALAGVVAALPLAAEAFEVTSLTEAGGGAAIASALGFGSVDNLDYTGATGQAGLFFNLVIAGARGTSMSLAAGVMMTSGSVLDLPAVNDSGSYSNLTEGDPGSKSVKKIVPSTTSSRGGAGTHDANEIAFRFDAPVNAAGTAAKAMTVRFVYASEEFPEWAGTIFSDGFAFNLKNGFTGSGLGTNYATFPTGEPVSLLTTAVNSNLLPNGSFGLNGPGAAPQIVALPYDGFTRVLEFTAPLDARDNRVTIGISDTGDQIYDSAVFIAPAVFHFDDAELGARLAAQSIGYVPVQAVPEPFEWTLMLAGLGMLSLRVRRQRSRDCLRVTPSA